MLNAQTGVSDGIRALAREADSLSATIERDRRLPRALVEGMTRAGVFKLCVPRSLGGLEADVASIVRVLEEIAAADGSAGWCAMIGATSGLVSGLLEPEVARTIYGAPEAVTGGVFAPKGKAIVGTECYVASGRWPFASGCQHCTWLMGGCLVFADGKPQLGTNGVPQARMLLFPADAVRIHDTWRVAGLCGTGSHDIEIQDLSVPVSYSVSLTDDSPRAGGPLYRFPVFGLLALGIAAVALGLARRATEELEHLAIAKTPTAARRRLAERSAVQADVARAHAELAAARAFLFDSIGEAEDEAANGEMPIATRAHLRLAASHATSAAAGVVDRMYDAGGGTSIYSESALQRCFRDVHVATQHLMVSPSTFELVGRVLLGVETDATML